MTYPSQPGYPTPHYGQPQPPQQQNNLWLIGGAILVVLIIMLTVILLVVQRTAGSDSSDSGDGGETGGETDDHSNLESTAFESEACEQFDLTAYEEFIGETVDPAANSHSSSSYSSYDGVLCYYYTSESFWSLNASFYDYETADDVLTFIEWDADTYEGDSKYEFSEYTAYGDAGTVYTDISDPSYQTTTLHVALGSLETKLSVSYDGSEVDSAAALTALEDILKQSDALFADVQ